MSQLRNYQYPLSLYKNGNEKLLLLLQPFYGPWTFSGTTRVSQYQKGKTRKVKPIWTYWSKRY